MQRRRGVWCGPSCAERRRRGCSGQMRAERGDSGLAGSGHVDLISRFAADGWRLRARLAALCHRRAPVVRADLTPSADRAQSGFVNFYTKVNFATLATWKPNFASRARPSTLRTAQLSPLWSPSEPRSGPGTSQQAELTRPRARASPCPLDGARPEHDPDLRGTSDA